MDLHDFELLGGDRVILSVYPHVAYFFLRRKGPFFFSKKGGKAG